jgi:hypothetical protein
MLSIEQKRAAIQLEWMMKKETKMTIKSLATKYKLKYTTVRRWKDRSTTTIIKKTGQRRTKYNQNIKRHIYKLAANKFTGAEQASSRKIMFKIRRKFKVDITHASVNNYLRKMLKKPRRAQKTFVITNDYKEQRLEFAKYIKENNITKVVILAGTHFKECLNESADYILDRTDFLKQSGVDVTHRLGQSPDDDLILISGVKHFISTGGGYGKLLHSVSAKNN